MISMGVFTGIFQVFSRYFDCSEVITWLPGKTNPGSNRFSNILYFIYNFRRQILIQDKQGEWFPYNLHTVEKVVLFSIKYFEYFLCRSSNFLKTASVMSILGGWMHKTVHLRYFQE
jgi:hypothetical protein